MRKFVYMMAFALVLSFSSTTKASLLENLLDFDNAVDTLRDASAGNVLDRGVAGTLDAGDIIQGIVHFNQIDGNFGFSGSYFAAYSFEVVTATATTVTVKAATGADNVMSALGGAGVVDGRTNTNYMGRGSVDAAVAVLETGTTGINLSTSDGSLGIGGNFGAAWTTVLTAGFVGSNSHVITSTGVDLTNLAAVGSVGASVEFARFAGTYSVTGHDFQGGNAIFAGVFNNTLGTFGELSISNGSLQGFDSTISGVNWAFQDDGDYKLNVVPEPASIALWSALGLGGLGLVIRRRFAK